MMQVDLFLAYGTGAMIAASAARETHGNRRTPASRCSRLLSAPLAACALFHAVLLAPAFVWLLSRFPAWETMQVLQRAPVWVMALFGASTVAFGLAGCIAGRWLSAKGNLAAAYVNLTVPWTLVFVVLTYGWDGQGYCRFLSPTIVDLASCADRPLREMAEVWARSDVAVALAAVVAVGVAVAVAVMACLRAAGARQEGLAATRCALVFLGFVVGGVLLPSLVVAVFAAATAWAAGPAAGAGVLASALLLCSRIGCTRWRTPLSGVLTPDPAPAAGSGALTDAG
ncbi:hypothetical protein AB0K93_24045 [Streptomyces sp. NPDC052676]|uniref:hypothetical protein n=1 Tax=Streptomyces sp. NPDC052676 TaxID=3154953 RepID=UPI003430C874